MRLTRRHVLKNGVISGAALLAGLPRIPHTVAAGTAAERQRADTFAGRQLGLVDFVNEGNVVLDTPVGTELDGRLYSDVSTLQVQDPVTPLQNFYVRTRASRLLPDSKSWQVRIEGLVERPWNLLVDDLKKTAKPMGLHLMECSGNTRAARFGLISVANWAGVPISEILKDARVKSQATQVLVSGFDQYETISLSSMPGASWIFKLDEIKSAGAFLATHMNGQPLYADHGAPVRLVVPGWYGCTCIKWVDKVALVDDAAEATSQMQEFAGRTQQDGVPRLAREYQPAIIEQAAIPIRVEKWLVQGRIQYRVVGIAWGGSRPVQCLEIRFNPEEDYRAVEGFRLLRNDPWTFWTHRWSPKSPGCYSIRLAVRDVSPSRARRLDSGYYVRTVKISEV